MSCGAAARRAAMLVAAAALSAPAGAAASEIGISVSNWAPAQGDAVFAEIVVAPPAESVTFVWKGIRVPARRAGENRFAAIVGVDLLDPPGPAPLEALVEGHGANRRIVLELSVAEKAFPTQALRLPPEMADFDPVAVARIRDEQSRMDRILGHVSPAPVWELPFVPPVEPFRPAGFGFRRTINDEPRASHAGVDVPAPDGTPVAAAAAGTVAFAGEQFLGGNSVVIDHGGGLFTIYYHLRDIAVPDGASVSRGQRIGSVGSTGRARGPHLHFGVRAPGGRVDPAPFFAHPPLTGRDGGSYTQ